MPNNGKKKPRKSVIDSVKNKTNSLADTDILFCSIDPGFSAPGFSILKEDFSHILTVHINGQSIRGSDYERAYEISHIIINHIKSLKLFKHRVCLIIEGSSYTPGSSSIEKLAGCRQAAYDAFREELKGNLVYCISVSPLEVKKDSTGNSKASKEEVFQWAIKAYPSVFSHIKNHYNVVTKTNLKRKKKKGDKKLSKKSENMADSLAICYSGILKWRQRI